MKKIERIAIAFTLSTQCEENIARFTFFGDLTIRSTEDDGCTVESSLIRKTEKIVFFLRLSILLQLSTTFALQLCFLKTC